MVTILPIRLWQRERDVLRKCIRCRSVEPRRLATRVRCTQLQLQLLQPHSSTLHVRRPLTSSQQLLVSLSMPSIAQLSGKTDITTTTTPSKYLPRWLTLKKKKRKEKRLAGAAAASHPCLLAANPGPLANVTVTLLYFTLLCDCPWRHG